jgi:parallel beta-helix repeat protein
MFKFKSIVFTLCSFTLLLGRAHAGVTEISSCPYNITQPGKYHVSQDLTCSLGYAPMAAAITISVDGVELHFDGHTLTVTNASPDGAAVSVYNANNAIIQGAGTIKGSGIDLVNASGVRIVNMSVTGAQVGINLEGASNNNTLISNTANSNIEGIQSSGNNNTLLSNQADGNLLNGISIAAGRSGNLIQANEALRNGYLDLVDENGSCANTWKSNRFTTSVGPCIN